MTGSRRPAGARKRCTDWYIRPVTTITCRPASRARRSARIVRGRRTPSSQTSVRSKSVATTATSRGSPAGSSTPALLTVGGGVDEGRHVADLLGAELPAEGRHRALALEDALHDQRQLGLRLVEVRSDGAVRVRGLERVAARAVGQEDRLAGAGIPLRELLRDLDLLLLRKRADDRLGPRLHRLAARHPPIACRRAEDHEHQRYGERQGETAHERGVYPRAAAPAPVTIPTPAHPGACRSRAATRRFPRGTRPGREASDAPTRSRRARSRTRRRGRLSIRSPSRRATQSTTGGRARARRRRGRRSRSG